MECMIFIAGLFVGIFFGHVLFSKTSVSGTLRIDQSNSEKDVYRFDIDDLDKLSKKKQIVLKVDSKADLSQK